MNLYNENAFLNEKQLTGELMTNWSKGFPKNNAYLINVMKLCKADRSSRDSSAVATGSPGSPLEVHTL